jgi:CRP/FNR family cyclic AMP-dependent transcriptional regulator
MNETRDKTKKVLEPIELPGKDPRGQIVEMILSLPIFQDLDPKEADLLARFVKPCRVQVDDIIFTEGDDGSFMSLIVEGLAEVSKQTSANASVKVAAEGMGRMLGEMSLVDAEPRSATARFVKSGTVLLLSKENADRIFIQHPQLGISILLRICRSLSQRLRRTTGILTDHLPL